MSLPPAILLMGPTAAGKTDLAIELTQKFNCEIISVDSAMVYRGMDIGTAKPDADTLKLAPHRLINIRDPADPYSAAEFRKDALNEMADITAAGKIPLLVGGTMLYFRALLHGLSKMPSADAEVRAQLEQEAEQNGWVAMHERLASIDPRAAQRIHPNDPQRIQRALEVYELTGIPMSDYHDQQKTEDLAYRITKIVVAPADRSLLHDRIAARFHQMLEQGLVAEVEHLYQRGDLHSDLPSIRTVGYRQVWAYLEDEWDHETMVEKAIVATRGLARRQLTWLRGEPDTHTFESTSPDLAEKALKMLQDATK